MRHDHAWHTGALPKYAVLDTAGQRIASSNVKWAATGQVGSLGYPGQEGSIAAFAKLLQKATPQMTAAELEQVVSYLKSVMTKKKPARVQDTTVRPSSH